MDSDQSLAGKYFFNRLSTAAWRFISDDGHELIAVLVRISKEHAIKHARWQPGMVERYKKKDILKGSGYIAGNWMIVTDLKASIILYDAKQDMIDLSDEQSDALVKMYAKS